MLAKVANLQTNVSHSVVAGEVNCVKCGRAIEWMDMEQWWNDDWRGKNKYLERKVTLFVINPTRGELG